ncbi:MAG: cysteine hydrolase family protein [bacterium]
MQNEALLVIDVQKYFFSRRSKAYIKKSEIVLPKINILIEHFNKRCALIVFAKFTAPVKDNSMKSWWKHMPSSDEEDFAEGLLMPANSSVLLKESYSPFVNTNFHEMLKKRKIERIFFTGVMTHLCVESAVRDSFEKGYKTTVIEDCCMSNRKDLHVASINIMRHGFSEILHSADIVNEKV